MGKLLPNPAVFQRTAGRMEQRQRQCDWPIAAWLRVLAQETWKERGRTTVRIVLIHILCIFPPCNVVHNLHYDTEHYKGVHISSMFTSTCTCICTCTRRPVSPLANSTYSNRVSRKSFGDSLLVRSNTERPEYRTSTVLSTPY